MADGAEIRTLLIPHDKPLGRLLLLTGRADFHEKWADAIRHLHGAGFATLLAPPLLAPLPVRKPSNVTAATPHSGACLMPNPP